MQFNYDSGGLQVDVAGALANRARIVESEERSDLARSKFDAEQRVVKNLAERDKNYANLYSIYRQSNDPNVLKDMMLVDGDRTKQIMELDADLTDFEKQSLADTVNEAKLLADNGMLKESRELLTSRNDILQGAGSGNKFTQPLATAALEADDDEFSLMLGKSYDIATGMGLITPPDPEEFETLGTFFDGKGNQFVWQQDTSGTMFKRYTTDTRQKIEEAERRKAAAKGGGIKYSQDATQRMGDLRNSIDEQASLASTASTLARKAQKIADTDDITEQGIAAKIKDFGLELLGEETPETFARKAYTGYFNKRVVADRPPGAMSNFEFRSLRAGYPQGTANPQLLANYFKDAAEASKLARDLDDMEGQFIQKTGGLFNALRGTSIDGIKVENGDSLDDFLDKWMYRKNEEKGKQLEKEAEARSEDDILSQYGIGN